MCTVLFGTTNQSKVTVTFAGGNEIDRHPLPTIEVMISYVVLGRGFKTLSVSDKC